MDCLIANVASFIGRLRCSWASMPIPLLTALAPCDIGNESINKKNAQGGFSIVELLVSLALMALVGYFLNSMKIKSQKAMGMHRDEQVVPVIRSRTNKILSQVLAASHSNPGTIDAIWKNDIKLDDDLLLSWIKTPLIPYIAQPDPIAKEALVACQKSRTLLKSWEGKALKERLGSKQMIFCGQLIKPGSAHAEAEAPAHGFILLTVSFIKAKDGAPITLAQFNGEGQAATVAWTLVWSYQKAQESVQQSRKGGYRIVPLIEKVTRPR